MNRPAHIPLDAVIDEPLAFEFVLPFSLKALDREPLLEISPVRLPGRVSRIEAGFSLEARVVFTGRLECSRCLSGYPFALDEAFSLLLYKRPEMPAGEKEIDREDLDVSFYDAEMLPVAPIAEERIQLAIPMKPLCREECLGLCPQCGQDRNLSPCDCRNEAVDPRWGALKEFRKAQKA